MSNCRGGIGPSAVSQLSSSELLSITRDASAFFGHRSNPTRFKSASEAQAYRKMLTIGAGVNGPRPVASAVIASVQAALPCRLRRSLLHRKPVIIQTQYVQIQVEPQTQKQSQEENTLDGSDVYRQLPELVIQEQLQEEEEAPESPVEDISIDIVPIPAVPEDVAREARLDAVWEIHTYATPAPKSAAPGFGGSVGSGDIAVGLSGPTTVRSFSQANPMKGVGRKA